MREAYERDGYVVVRAVAEVGPLLAALAALPAAGPLVPSPPLDLPALDALAAEVLGGPVVVFGTTFLVKPAGDGLPALWHQDGHPWQERLGSAAAVTAWVALDPSTPASGGLRVVPGSHHLPARPLRPNAELPSLFGAELDPALVDDAAAVDLVLAPGDASLHHPNLVHGSGPNRSDHPRRALAVRYRVG